MKNTSVDRACRDESDDVSLKEKQRGFHDQKRRFFDTAIHFFWSDVIRKRAERRKF